MDGPSIFAANQANSGGVLVVLSHKSLFLSELLPKLKPCVVMEGEKWSNFMAGIAQTSRWRLHRNRPAGPWSEIRPNDVAVS
jgi:hypothetical protein